MKALTPEVLAYGLSIPFDAQVSPNGRRIAYVVETVDPAPKSPQSAIWLCDVDGARVRPLVPGLTETREPRWSPDGTLLAFTAATDDGRGIFVIAPDGGSARVLVRHRQGIDELAWAPDGGRIAYTTAWDPEDPDEQGQAAGSAPRVRVTRRLDYKEDGRGYLGDRRTHIFVANVEGGRSRRVTTELRDHSSPQWSPDGRRLAVGVRQVGGSRLVLLDLESGAADAVSPEEGMLVHWAWSPAGNRLVYATDPNHTLQADYFLYELATGSTRRLTDDLGADLDSDTPPVWLDARTVLFTTVRAGASGLERLDVESGAIETFERAGVRTSGLSVDRARRRVVCTLTTLTSPPEIAVRDLDDGAQKIVSGYADPILIERPPAVWERLEVASEGLAIEAWLLKPPDFDPARRYPLVLDVHGGPTSCHGYRFTAHQQCLATSGFLVLAANPRGSSSYGRDFARGVIRDWGGGDYRDLMAVLDAVLQRPYADGERTGIFGISYGGYMTAWAIGQTNRFRAAVCGEPIFDLESDYGTSDVAFNGLEKHGGGPPHEEREWYLAHSPSTFAHRTRTPTLIFHGEEDARCPIGQSEQMFVLLKKAGCEVEYVRYPGGSHMFFVLGPPEHRADFLARTLGWFREQLGEPV